MSKKFGFLSGLDEEQSIPKTKYQLFEAEMGFEKASVLVPLDQADAFEKEALAVKPKSKITFEKLASKYGGSIQ
jgi:hypothetical protein